MWYVLRFQEHSLTAMNEQYIDSLFKDLGLESRRKSSAVAEIFSPYHPHDFNGFIDEYLAKKDVMQTDDEGC